ncbi:hypothetical protein DFH08DRAFT_818868 [Mycena albidolilacea]|uniref:Uncharacterized protein n=1 Tax=Mycena albidolilacea TaxID=1033008 RepID=A0AAD7EH71_9AGAR|nr:hypothetical protein DFH08DRAFT_818868 [Mycena albidolilacea]
MDELRNDPAMDCWSHGKGTEASRRVESKQISRVGRKSQRYSDGMRGTGENSWKATRKDAVIDEQRNDPGRGLPEPWERSWGIWKDRAEAEFWSGGRQSPGVLE